MPAVPARTRWKGRTRTKPKAGSHTEADLQNHLSRSLERLKSGLRLHVEEGIKGIEFPVGGRFIDILAVDRSNALVVIEAKVSRGHDRTVGQWMYYVGWIKQSLTDED